MKNGVVGRGVVGSGVVGSGVVGSGCLVGGVHWEKRDEAGVKPKSARNQS